MEKNTQKNGPGDSGDENGGAGKHFILNKHHEDDARQPPGPEPPDEQLQAEVEVGQMDRGNSEWGSPPFPTRAFEEHRHQRKRRLVVDYR